MSTRHPGPSSGASHVDWMTVCAVHVAEDFVTTFLAMVIAGMNRPDLLSDNQRVQVVFTDEFEVSGNHFTSVCAYRTSHIRPHPERATSSELC